MNELSERVTKKSWSRPAWYVLFVIALFAVMSCEGLPEKWVVEPTGSKPREKTIIEQVKERDIVLRLSDTVQVTFQDFNLPTMRFTMPKNIEAVGKGKGGVELDYEPVETDLPFVLSGQAKFDIDQLKREWVSEGLHLFPVRISLWRDGVVSINKIMNPVQVN